MTNFPALIDGYHRFRASLWEQERSRWSTLAQGQSPKTLVIACSDSRVDPAQLFDAPPGTIFSIRNVAALVPPCETGGGRHGVSAALEFGVTQLEVSDVVVMGHAACGGCQASLSKRFANADPGDGRFIDDWIGLLAEAREAVVEKHGDGEQALRALEYAAVRVSLANLRTFPFVAEREAAGTLRLHGAYFAIADGEMRLLDEATGCFGPA
jgi:carbonic anhydrase